MGLGKAMEQNDGRAGAARDVVHLNVVDVDEVARRGAFRHLLMCHKVGDGAFAIVRFDRLPTLIFMVFRCSTGRCGREREGIRAASVEQARQDPSLLYGL